MAYTTIDFKSKKDIKEALAKGRKITCYQPGGLSEVPVNGTVYLEGPHYPLPHKWYAVGQMKDGYLESIK